MNIKAIVEPGEDGYFVAHVPSLKSCWSQGKTREEALQNIREAIDLYLEPEPKRFFLSLTAKGARLWRLSIKKFAVAVCLIALRQNRLCPAIDKSMKE